MARFIGVLVVAFSAVTAPAAQSEWAPSRAAVAVGASYAGAVAGPAGMSLGDTRAPGVALDATTGRFSVGVGVLLYEYETPVEIAAGVHLARNPSAQLATTLGVGIMVLEDDESAGVLSITHGRRAAGGAGWSAVPFGRVGLAASLAGGIGDQILPVAGGGIAAMAGRGRVRAVLTPAVAWAGGAASTVSVGVTAGVVVGR